MRRPGGYAIIVDPDRPTVEYDTVGCAHCGAPIFVKPNTLATIYLRSRILPSGLILWEETPGAGCFKCGMRAICLRCEALGVCRPFERWLDEQEGTKRPDQVSLVLGGV